ncbi:MAG: hypothetical protein KTQ49_07625, partial [Candidatus Omnitrophica bacterium]|nr:hypothetical protein [Candidatus Omnitrophota bacterium]
MNEAKRSLYRNTSSLRGIALFTLPLFFATQVFLPLPESLAMPGLPTGQADSRQARSAPNTQVTEGDPVTATATGQVLNGTIAVPSELGLVDEVYRATVNGQRTTSDFSEKENALRVARSTLPAAEGRKTIVFVQDAHNSLEAQENIAKIIDYLVANYGVKTVFEEGYEGTVPTDEFFGFIQDPVLKQKVSYFFLDKLRIGGAEYAHINRATHNAQRKTGEVLSLRVERDTLPAVQSAATAEWQLIGADSLELHKANVDQYRFSAMKQEAIARDLKALQKELKQLADRRFPKPLKEWLKLREQFDAKKLDLLTYLTRTIELIVPQEAKHGKVPRNAQRTTSEKKSNKNTLSVERCPLPQTFISPLLQFLVEAAKSNDPVVLEKAKHIDAREVFTALGDLENTVEEAFLKSPEDKKLFRYVQTLDLLDRLNNLQVTQEEYTALKNAVGFAPRDLYLARNQNESRVPSLESREGRFLPPPFVDTQGLAEFIHKQTGKPLVLSKQWERNIKEAVKFYEIAQQRDSALAAVIDKYFLQKRNGQRTTRNGQRQPVRQAGPTDNAQRESDSLSVARSTLSKPVRSAADLKLPDSETAILVYGGFHKENIKRILEAKGINYVIVSPRITKPSPRHENYYKQLMTDGMLPFERTIAPATATRPSSIFENGVGSSAVQAVYETVQQYPDADPSILERYLSGDPGPVLGKAVIYDAYALGKIKEPELGPEIELGESEIALVRGTPEQLELVRIRTSVTRCFLLKITGSLGGERLMFAAHFTAGQFARLEQAVKELIPPRMNVEERELSYSEYAFSRWPDRRGAFDAFIQNLRFSEKEIHRLNFSDREPYTATLAPLRSEARVAFTNTGEEKEHSSNGEIPVSGYHRIIKELFKGKDFLDHTLQRVIPGQDITPFILAPAISVTFIACAAETRIYRVSVRPVSGGKPVVFALAVGQDSRVFEDQEAAKRRAHGEAPYSVKQEFLNLQKMNRILPQNVVEPYVYMESGAQGLPQFPIFSMQYAAGSHAIYAIYASDAFRLVSQLGSKSMWQMVENDFRKFLKHFFKLQIQLFLGTGEVFHIALPQGDLMYPAQTATKPVGPPYPFDSKQEFKTVPYDETLPLMLTSGSFSAKATKGFLVQTLFGGEQVVNSQRRWRLDSPFFSLPYKDVAVAFYLAMEDLFPEEGKEKTIEWLQAYLEEYESFERPEVVAFVKKFIQELSGNIASADKTITGDTQVRSEVRESGADQSRRAEERDPDPDQKTETAGSSYTLERPD